MVISYSREAPRILDFQERLKISAQIRTLLKKQIGDLSRLKCLDLGCSSGVITKELARDFQSVEGIDADIEAIAIAKEKYHTRNIRYRVMSGEHLTFKDNCFDVVICNQVYQFVDKPKLMVKEVYRVLKIGGICLMGARNKYSIYEAQTGIPLIHFLPVLNKRIIKLPGKTYFPANYLSYFSLKKLFDKFEINNLTSLILKSPDHYGFVSLSKYGPFFKLMPGFLMELLMPLIPNYIFLLKKSR